MHERVGAAETGFLRGFLAEDDGLLVVLLGLLGLVGLGGDEG